MSIFIYHENNTAGTLIIINNVENFCIFSSK